MSKSLADLRAARSEPRRPECSLTLCLAPDLMAEAQSLQTELESLTVRENSTPKRAGQSGSPRVKEIRARQLVVFDEMAEYEGELRLRANLDDGEWRRWCNAHPARGDDNPGHDRDERVTFGYCNADDLLDELGRFAHRWNGEPLAEGDWSEVIEPNAYPGDKADMARKIVEMYEGSSADFRPWRTALHGNLKRLSGFASPAPSESATNGSTDGSPEPSSTDSTETATA